MRYMSGNASHCHTHVSPTQSCAVHSDWYTHGVRGNRNKASSACQGYSQKPVCKGIATSLRCTVSSTLGNCRASHQTGRDVAIDAVRKISCSCCNTILHFCVVNHSSRHTGQSGCSPLQSCSGVKVKTRCVEACVRCMHINKMAAKDEVNNVISAIQVVSIRCMCCVLPTGRYMTCCYSLQGRNPWHDMQSITSHDALS